MMMLPMMSDEVYLRIVVFSVEVIRDPNTAHGHRQGENY